MEHPSRDVLLMHCEVTCTDTDLHHHDVVVMRVHNNQYHLTIDMQKRKFHQFDDIHLFISIYTSMLYILMSLQRCTADVTVRYIVLQEAISAIYDSIVQHVVLDFECFESRML